MKRILISLLTLIFIISISISANAATTGGISLALSKDTIKAGDEFSVVVTATDSNNINTVEYTTVTVKDQNGNISKDIEVKSVEAVSSNWYNQAEGQSNYFVYSGEKTESQEVFKITFTVKDTISSGIYNIDVNGLKVYSLNLEDDTTDIGTKSISVKAIVDDTTVGNQNGNNPSNDGDNSNTGDNGNTNSETENKNENKNVNTNNNTNKNTNTNKNNNTTKLPQTGAESASLIAIVALGIVSIISYISYRKYNNI